MTEDPAANPDDPGPPDYDSPWKEAIDAWLPPFMALFFPTVHTLIDWDRPYEFLAETPALHRLADPPAARARTGAAARTG